MEYVKLLIPFLFWSLAVAGIYVMYETRRMVFEKERGMRRWLTALGIFAVIQITLSALVLAVTWQAGWRL